MALCVNDTSTQEHFLFFAFKNEAYREDNLSEIGDIAELNSI